MVSSVERTTGQRIAASSIERVVKKGEVLQTQGEMDQKLVIVKVGLVVGTRQIGARHAEPVAVMGKGCVLGGWALLGQTSMLGTMALTSCRVCEISVDELYRIGAVDRSFLNCLYGYGARLFSSLTDWANVMHVKGVEQRLYLALHLLAQQTGGRRIRLPSHVVLASLLSITRESVARSLRLLEERGVLTRLDRWHCELHCPVEAIEAKVEN